MNRKIIAIAAVVMMLSAQSAWAAMSCPVAKWADEKKASNEYLTRTSGMLASGVHSLVEAPVEVGYHLYTEPKTNFDNGLGLLRGLATGLARGGEKIARGGVDIVGALVPDFHGIPDDTHSHMKG